MIFKFKKVYTLSLFFLSYHRIILFCHIILMKFSQLCYHLPSGLHFQLPNSILQRIKTNLGFGKAIVFHFTQKLCSLSLGLPEIWLFLDNKCQFHLQLVWSSHQVSLLVFYFLLGNVSYFTVFFGRFSVSTVSNKVKSKWGDGLLMIFFWIILSKN